MVLSSILVRMKWMFCFWVCCIATIGRAQFTDDFSDGEFYTDPTWAGNDTSFVVDNGWLRSQGPQASSTIYMSTPSSLMDSCEWSFLLRLDFNPSSTNFVKVFLASSSADLKSSLNGYYVYFGGTGNTDTLLIYKQTGTTVTKIFSGSQALMTSSTTNTVRINVQRKAGGIWSAYADNTGGNNFVFQGSFTDNTFSTTSHFGVLCDYNTASRYNMYYFDDIEIKTIVPDLIKPVATGVTVVSPNDIDIKFSEAVDLTTAENNLNYQINNGIGSPVSATRDAADFSIVRLSLFDALNNGINYIININNVKDVAANTMNPAALPFSYYQPGAYDILINELMADPTPVVGLPNIEFVELHNRTAFAINVGGWKISDPSSTATLPAYTIAPDSFVVLLANSNFDSLPSTVPKLSLASLPSLNNTSDDLMLTNNSGVIIHKVSYSISWYNHPVKSDGGWTLELINPQNPCQSTNNWTASVDLSGGTPGKRNSVYNISANSTFSLIGIDVISTTEIVLLFNQNVSPTDANQATIFSINQQIGQPLNSALDSLDFSKVHLYFSNPLDVSTIYTATASIQNCAGQTISAQNSFQFAVPQPADKFDVLMNEVFPDPTPVVGLPEAEFVELYNRSNKAINLLNWELGKAGSSTTAKLPNYLLMPDSLVIVTSNTNGILFAAYANVLAISSFPSLTNTGDNLLLKNNTGSLIHYVPYTDDWYNDNNKKDGGWTLEMIDPENPCNGKENWQASTHPSGGTPGKKNSVVTFNPDTTFPQVIRAALLSPTSLLVYFSEPIDNGLASNPANFNISNGVGNPALALPVPYAYNTVQLEFLQPFIKGIIYTATVSNLSDCNGNPIGMSNTARFAIPDTAASGDVIINEILFNPRTAGYDFVELYNLSNKVIDLKDLEILEMDYKNPSSILEKTFLSAESYLLFPQEYVVLTQNTENIKSFYHCENPFAVFLVSGLPNYDDNESICMLRLKNSTTIDSLAYKDDWHFALLDDENGVSLERIAFDLPTQNPSSWHSAASTVGYATPTYLNSQFSASGITDNAVTINPEVFTPDNDGDKDFTFIEYQFTEPGYLCNITLFDAVGREIKALVRNELLAATGKYQWDGTDNNGKKARIGIYIAYVEVFNLQGKVKRFKKQLVLSGRLND